MHCFMDGRDTPPKSGAGYMRELVETMQELHCGKVATISGRYWAMDRDTRWDRVRKGLGGDGERGRLHGRRSRAGG